MTTEGSNLHRTWEDVDFNDLQEGDVVRLGIFTMEDGWEPQTRVVTQVVTSPVNPARAVTLSDVGARREHVLTSDMAYSKEPMSRWVGDSEGPVAEGTARAGETDAYAALLRIANSYSWLPYVEGEMVEIAVSPPIPTNRRIAREALAALGMRPHLGYDQSINVQSLPMVQPLPMLMIAAVTWWHDYAMRLREGLVTIRNHQAAPGRKNARDNVFKEIAIEALDATGPPEGIAAVVREPVLTIPLDLRLTDGRTLWEHIAEWQNAPSNTASAHIEEGV